MNEYYTSIELGTDSIKVLVCNKVDRKYHVIAAVSSPSKGIKRGMIVDTKDAINSCKKAVKKVNEMLGIKITKAIVTIPTDDCRMDIVVGSTNVIDSTEVTGKDISNVLKDSVVGWLTENEELVTATPISFKVDDEDNIKDPKGYRGEELDAKVVIATSPKEIVYKVLEVVKLSGIEAIDIVYKSTADYYEVRNNETDKVVSAVINVGEDSTNISIFNKGIMIKNKIINVGSINVDKDLSYIYKVDNKLARKLKEEFVIAKADYADSNEVSEIKTIDGKEIELKQNEVSKVVEARLRDILKISKNELKNLTKREISYIIVLGGVSEIAGFQYLVEDELGIDAKISDVRTIGIRHNKYSTTLGAIKYLDSKLALRGKSVKMINSEDITNLISVKDSKDSNENIVNRFFGKFFEN